MSDDELRSVDDYDREIAELQAERDRLEGLLTDPLQREARMRRREQLAGRWAVTLPLTGDQVSSIREVAGEGESWLWDPNVLSADGWAQDDGGAWSLPSEAGRS